MAAINAYFDNFVLENEINDLYESHLDASIFCTPDTSLTATAGDIVKVNVYDATSGAEEVAMGEGNSKQIKVSLTTKDYTVKTVQTRFAYLDEEARRDPVVPITGAQKATADLVNKMNEDIFAAMDAATKSVTPSGDTFADVIDAMAELNLDSKADNGNESLNPGASLFVVLNKKDLAKLRKSAKDSLQYVEAYVRTGYVGTLAGANVYVSNLAKEGTIYVGHPSALKLITKATIQTEYDRDPNTRTNWVYERQAYIPALVDETKLCLIKAA